MPEDLAHEEAFSRERFLMRARALFYARLALLVVGLAMVLVPAWAEAFELDRPGALAIYLVMVAYSAVNYVFLEKRRVGAVLTFVTLCFDLLVLVYLVSATGGLRSPLLATQLIYTVLFVLLFPRPYAIIPPLLTFPVVAKIQEILDEGWFLSIDLFVLVWYSVINCVVVYLMVYLNAREEMQHRHVRRLEQSLRQLAVAEERNRLAREIHDGLGGSLSSLILQAEYLQARAEDASLREEIGELKGQAEESIEELRRSLSMMRGEFDLVRGVDEVCRKFEARNRGLEVSFTRSGHDRPVGPEASLALFRVLQESLTNVARHAQARRAEVRLAFDDEACELSVEDDGKGFDAAAAPPVGHYGLLNIQERARHVDGTARVDSTPGKGTRVSLRVPVTAPLFALPLPHPGRAA